jgi:hypothetical protein
VRASFSFTLALVALGACTNPRDYPLTRDADADDPGEGEPRADGAPLAPTRDGSGGSPGGADAGPPAADAPQVLDAPPPPGPDGPASCLGGTHLCGQRCLRDDDLDSCGQSCDPCPRPSPGTVACVQGRCQLSCPAGYHDCQGVRCASNMSVDSCGTFCGRCDEVANGDPTCDGVSCGIRCKPGFFTCRAQRLGQERVVACASPTIGFEDGTKAGFYLSSGIGVDAPAVSTKVVHSGSYALAQAVRGHAEADDRAYFCAGGGTDVIGKTLSLWYYFDGTPPPGARLALHVGNTFWGSGAGDWPVVAQRWTKVAGAPITYPSAKDTADIGITLDVVQAPDGYSATLYIDDIAFE